MELQELFKLREVANKYRTTISELGYSNPSVENIDALHDKIANVDLNEMPELFMRIDTKLKHHIEFSLIGCFENLEKDIKNHMQTIFRFDKRAFGVMEFCNRILEALHKGIDTLNNRIATTPDADDIRTLDILNGYIDGNFGDMDFNKFVDEFVTAGLFPDWRIERRINYLISSTDNEQFKSALSLYLAKRMESQKPKPSPSVQPTAKEVATLPDFSHMVSYKPTKPFDMHALYEFLICDGVIDDIDEQLFTDCITHARMNEVFSHGVISKIKLVIVHLKNHFPKSWYNSVCENYGVSKSEITRLNVPKRKDFENKLTMLK